MKIPILQIETINACNAKCVFCPVTRYKLRPPMPPELFSKIIDDAREYGIKEIYPFLNGEPLLDKSFIVRIKEINEKIPDARVYFYTNGSLLTPAKVEELKTVKIAAVHFSVNAISDKARMRVMGLPLEPTIVNILHFRDECPDVQISVSAIVDTTLLTPDEMNYFAEFWKVKRIPAKPFFNGNWAGKTREVVNVEGGCSRPSDFLTVLSDGTVALCCYDLRGEVPLGSLQTSTIREIWESEALDNYRFLNDAGRRDELPLCNKCTTG